MYLIPAEGAYSITPDSLTWIGEGAEKEDKKDGE